MIEFEIQQEEKVKRETIDNRFYDKNDWTSISNILDVSIKYKTNSIFITMAELIKSIVHPPSTSSFQHTKFHEMFFDLLNCCYRTGSLLSGELNHNVVETMYMSPNSLFFVALLANRIIQLNRIWKMEYNADCSRRKKNEL